MRTLALDVDGVLLDSERNGAGHWTNELGRRYGITREQLRRAFFIPFWGDVVNGRMALEPALAQSLSIIGTSASVDQVIECWFEADFVVIDAAVDLAHRAAATGVHVVLATNQEHRRARFLCGRLGQLFLIRDVVYSADLGVQKHECVFFDLASERLNVNHMRSDVVFVDDLELNVQAATDAGWTAILATPEKNWIRQVGQLLDLPATDL